MFPVGLPKVLGLLYMPGSVSMHLSCLGTGCLGSSDSIKSCQTLETATPKRLLTCWSLLKVTGYQLESKVLFLT